MLEFKPLTIKDKDLFDKYLKPYVFETCEYSFTNLFIWRKALDIEYAIYEDALIILKSDFHGDLHFMQPVGYTKENLKDIVDFLITLKSELQIPHLFKDAEEWFVKELIEVYGEDKNLL